MSTRFEFIDAARASVESWTWQQVYEETDEKLPEDQRGLIIGGDEVTVLAGTLSDLRAFAERLTAVLASVDPLPELPATPPVDDERYGNVTCPFVRDDGTVCGAEVNLWDKEPVRRDLRFVAGRYVAGPSRVADDGGGDEEVQCYEGHTWAVPEIDEWQ